MTKDDKELLEYKMEAEGFDYCFLGYSDWKEVKNDKFQKLREAYVNAYLELKNYIIDFEPEED